jgi:orotidine-5'-phosphate decarboxylase
MKVDCEKASFEARFNLLADQRSPFCLGVDPSSSMLGSWELPDTIGGLTTFCDRLAGWIGSSLAVVKPQIAYFERFGPKGLEALVEFVHTMQEQKALVLLDAKRGDIDATNEAYGQAVFDRQTGYGVDAVTVSPYLGFDALEPLFAAAEGAQGAVFVVVASSNPEGRFLQNARTETGLTISEALADAIAERNRRGPRRCCGAVIGATRDDVGVSLVARIGEALILVPGLGAQGASYNTISMMSRPRSVIPTAARSILAQGHDRSAFVDALNVQREAAYSLRV